jgi:hypothetical protein
MLHLEAVENKKKWNGEKDKIEKMRVLSLLFGSLESGETVEFSDCLIT